MSAAKAIYDRLISAGMDAAEVLGLLSRHAAESVPQNAPKSSAAVRQKRYRERNESVTNRNADDRNETVTNHNETITRDASISISSFNKEEKERKIDIPERHALHPKFAPSPEAEKIARQKGFEIGEVLEIYRNHLKATGQTSRDYDASFCNFMLNRRIFSDAQPPKGEPLIGYQPTPEEFDRAADLFAKSASLWSSQLGPEPGMGGCRCPPEILVRHGIDPKTGLRMQ